MRRRNSGLRRIRRPRDVSWSGQIGVHLGLGNPHGPEHPGCPSLFSLWSNAARHGVLAGDDSGDFRILRNRGISFPKADAARPKLKRLLNNQIVLNCFDFDINRVSQLVSHLRSLRCRQYLSPLYKRSLYYILFTSIDTLSPQPLPPPGLLNHNPLFKELTTAARAHKNAILTSVTPPATLHLAPVASSAQHIQRDLCRGAGPRLEGDLREALELLGRSGDGIPSRGSQRRPRGRGHVDLDHLCARAGPCVGDLDAHAQAICGFLYLEAGDVERGV